MKHVIYGFNQNMYIVFEDQLNSYETNDYNLFFTAIFYKLFLKHNNDGFKPNNYKHPSIYLNFQNFQQKQPNSPIYSHNFANLQRRRAKPAHFIHQFTTNALFIQFTTKITAETDRRRFGPEKRTLSRLPAGRHGVWRAGVRTSADVHLFVHKFATVHAGGASVGVDVARGCLLFLHGGFRAGVFSVCKFVDHGAHDWSGRR